ncbi:MAG: phosphatidate cytidylyltransferase [Acidobacteria bacterium]|nr:phosphatidate cytidylyltransferase [Acidobacteriota bacterium]
MRRLLTALVLIPVIIYLVLWAPSWALAAAGTVFAQAALWEYFRMAEAVSGSRMLHVPGHAISIALMAVALTDFLAEGTASLILLLLLIVLSAAMSPQRNLAHYFPTACGTLLGVAYTTVPLSVYVWISRQEGGAPLVLFTMVVVWASDSTAYFTGLAFGKHLAFPRISPKKTWEGVAGSMVGAMIVGVAGYFIFHDWTVFLLSVAVNIAAQIGDLVESAMKRSAGVKDSSQLVPGHGGVLDRIDALLFAAPMLWYYWLLMKH